MGRSGSPWSAALRTPVGIASALLLVAVLLLGALAPLLWSEPASAIDTAQILRPPSAQHWVGTDALGRDILARVLVATRLSVLLALAATGIGVAVGLLLGTAPLWLGARLGRLVTAAVNIAVAFPGLLLALFFAVIFGVGATGALLAIGLAVAPGFARLTQTLTARIAGLDFVSAARIAGVGRARLIVRHFLPNIGEPLVVNATIAAGGALLSFAGLSFLGLGVQAPDYDWGRLLGEGLGGIYINPSAALAPGIAVVVAGLAFNLSGETVARAIGLRSPAVQAGTGEPEPVGVAMADPGARPVLTVDGLRVAFPGPHGPVVPVRDATFTLQAGETAGIVGESGSGKSLTALALAQLLEPPARVTARGLRFLGVDLLSGPPRAHRRLLGASMAMVFQDPMTSLNPTMRVGRQLAEVAEQHGGLDRRQALVRAVERLQAVHLTEPARRARQFPHQLSGGMRQRAMIGLGLMVRPALIVADEPTTALDTTVQQQVLRLLRSIRDSDGVALLLISHDLTVVGDVCDRVLVMYAGRIVEDLPSAELPRARHPYTRALLASVPNLATDRTQPLPTIPGRPADPARLPAGCAFAPRCPLADARCRIDDPPLQADGAGRVACWHAGEEPA